MILDWLVDKKMVLANRVICGVRIIKKRIKGDKLAFIWGVEGLVLDGECRDFLCRELRGRELRAWKEKKEGDWAWEILVF